MTDTDMIGKEHVVCCPTCKGTGVSPEPPKKCQCNGSGKVRVLTLVIR